MTNEWTKLQWEQYHLIVEVSQKMSHEWAKRAMRDAGLWPCTFGAFTNIEDHIGEAIRRGAIEILTLQAQGKEKWLTRDFKP